MVTLSKPPLLDEAVGLTSRPYQTEGVDFLWRAGRAMITDAPGLGKTPQAALAAELPCIVVAPTYLTQQWGSWIREHLPQRSVAVARGTRAEKLDTLIKPVDFLVINKEMLRTHLDELIVIAKRYRIKTVIFDESHHLRNRATAASKGAVLIGQVVDRVYLLTATPIWKEVDDLFMQLRIIHPDVFKSYYEFVDTWCVADNTRFGPKVMGIKKSMLPALNDMMDVIRIGRTYEQAGRDLPPVIENIVRLDFEKQQRKFYDDLVNTYRIRLQDEPDIFLSSYMAVMHTLRQVTAVEKLDPIQEQVEDSRPYHNGKYVIFTWYKDFAEALHRALPETVLITGDEKPDERARLAKTGKPIVATLGSLSEGVDLSWARMVLFAEEHWPPGSAVQSLARIRRERLTSIEFKTDHAHAYKHVHSDEEMREELTRINEEPVLVYYIIVAETIDDTIHKTTRRRSATVKEVMSEALGIYL